MCSLCEKCEKWACHEPWRVVPTPYTPRCSGSSQEKQFYTAIFDLLGSALHSAYSEL